MIPSFRQLPIRRKLIAMIMATSLAVVLVATIGFLAVDYVVSRGEVQQEAEGQAGLVLANVSAALEFLDVDDATATLQTLTSSPSVRVACLYDKHGRLFAHYKRPDAIACEVSVPTTRTAIDNSRLTVSRSQYLNGSFIGTLVVRHDLATVERRFRRQSLIALGLLLIAGAVAMAMSSRLQSLISEPLLALSHTASEVSSRGDYSLRAERKSEDEVGTLTDAFNRMLERIQMRESELSKANDELRHEIGERRRAEQERAEMLVREREANRLKDEFLATLSHELRTPLNAILGWTKLLRTSAIPPGSRDRALEKVERNATVQARLVDDLLEISRITTGKLRLDVRRFDLVGLANTAIDSIRPTAEARGVTIERQFDSPSLQTGGDPDRLQQVIWNLLSNAVKFTPPGGTVTIGLHRRGDTDTLTVTDTGIGIDPSFLPNVFETFRQADASSTRAHGGLGLGLSIVRHLVDMHAGTVRAESAGRGAGATFTVELPVRSPAGETPGDAAARPVARRLLEGYRVLAIDDDPDTRELLYSTFLAAGADASAAATAEEALAACIATKPDAIVSDIGMPGRDGLALIRDIREALGARMPRVAVAVSAYAAPGDRERSLDAGFQQHIAKPVDPESLVRTLSTLLNERLPMREPPVQT
jgi:signal transduction histidine kinase/ActR/RegA family two-component response regulator